MTEAKVEVVIDKHIGVSFPSFVTHYQIVKEEKARTRWVIQLQHEFDIPRFIHFFSSNQIAIYEVKPITPHLEDVFLHWVNQKKENTYVDNQ
ncbi:hypothetical protein [Radiobacillus deserti]|uniref:DUF4162 domain-containing protein n=1 Tax=Radiobacillus deserti TaxID=2594883 RepID=A0A516KEX9_9BACI|nr:hypothetical protein [Radiobacillus deserti]QDP39961.1 hypothetical protein FN924_07150 [Radiobacillus deserti]